MKKLIIKLPYIYIITLCFTLGLAPFTPPHVYQKLVLLFTGNLNKSADIFDLLMHGLPWVILFIKILVTYNTKKEKNK